MREHYQHKNQQKYPVEYLTITVLFVRQTPGGELAKRLQKVEDRLSLITGYRVRVTDTAASQLCRVLPNTNPWKGMDCMRADCYPCTQCGEKLQDFKKRNILYEAAVRNAIQRRRKGQEVIANCRNVKEYMLVKVKQMRL